MKWRGDSDLKPAALPKCLSPIETPHLVRMDHEPALQALPPAAASTMAGGSCASAVDASVLRSGPPVALPAAVASCGLEHGTDAVNLYAESSMPRPIRFLAQPSDI